MVCEKCWSKAFDPYGEKSQYKRYLEILHDNRNNPCSPKEQAGDYWDEENKIDLRLERLDAPKT